MRKSFFILILLNGIVLHLNAQNVYPPIEKCDSIVIDCINPAIMTVVDLHEEAFEKYLDRKKKNEKRHVVICDSTCIREIMDSVYTINPIKSLDAIDVRGRFTFFSANGEKIVFYVGLCRLSYKGVVYNASPFAFQLLYTLFKEAD